MGDVHVGDFWRGGSCWSVRCVLCNKTVTVGNGLAGGPVKNCPLNVFQLSKHWCLSSLCREQGEPGAAAWGAAPGTLCLLFAISLPSPQASELWKSTRNSPLTQV